ESQTIPSVDSPNRHLSEPAEQQLAALRSSVEVHLAALEAALADPARADALEGLILDLARVACEEAQSAAVHACIDIRLEADMHIAQARGAAQTAVETEFAASADVRRALDEARQQVAAVQHEVDEDLRQVRASFEVEIAKERTAKGETERAAARLERA